MNADEEEADWGTPPPRTTPAPYSAADDPFSSEYVERAASTLELMEIDPHPAQSASNVSPSHSTVGLGMTVDGRLKAQASLNPSATSFHPTFASPLPAPPLNPSALTFRPLAPLPSGTSRSAKYARSPERPDGPPGQPPTARGISSFQPLDLDDGGWGHPIAGNPRAKADRVQPAYSAMAMEAARDRKRKRTEAEEGRDGEELVLDEGGNEVTLVHVDTSTFEQLQGWTMESWLDEATGDIVERYLGVSHTSISVGCSAPFMDEIDHDEYEKAVAKHFLRCGYIRRVSSIWAGRKPAVLADAEGSKATDKPAPKDPRRIVFLTFYDQVPARRAVGMTDDELVLDFGGLKVQLTTMWRAFEANVTWVLFDRAGVGAARALKNNNKKFADGSIRPDSSMPQAPLPPTAPFRQLPKEVVIRLLEDAQQPSISRARTLKPQLTDVGELRNLSGELLRHMPAQYQADNRLWMENHWRFPTAKYDPEGGPTINGARQRYEHARLPELNMRTFSNWEAARGLGFGDDTNPLSELYGAPTSGSNCARDAVGIDRLAATLTAPLLHELGGKAYLKRYIPTEAEMWNVRGGVSNAMALEEFRKSHPGQTWFPFYSADYTDDDRGKEAVMLKKGRYQQRFWAEEDKPSAPFRPRYATATPSPPAAPPPPLPPSSPSPPPHTSSPPPAESLAPLPFPSDYSITAGGSFEEDMLLYEMDE